MIALNADFCLALGFLIFVFLIFKPVKRIILNILDSNIEKIRVQINESKQLNQEMLIFLQKITMQLEEISTLKTKILKDDEELTNKLIALESYKLEKFLDYKKDANTEIIYAKKVKAFKALQSKLALNTLELVLLYMQETKNNNVLDIEIAKGFIFQALSTNK